MAEANDTSPSPPQTLEIDETTPLLSPAASDPSAPSPSSNPLKSVEAKVPSIEIHLYKQGKGPIATFKAELGGYEQDQLEVREILEKYGLKRIYAFSPSSGRSVPIRFGRNGRSILGYEDGAVVFIDGEPKDSLIKPITKILVGVAVITILIAIFVKETPAWAEKLNLRGTRIPPWLITCAIIVFTRWRKRTRDFLQNRGGENRVQTQHLS